MNNTNETGSQPEPALNRLAFGPKALAHVVPQRRLSESLRDAFLAAFDPLRDLRHLGGETALHMLLAVGAGEPLRLGFVAASVARSFDLFAYRLPARIRRSCRRRTGARRTAVELSARSSGWRTGGVTRCGGRRRSGLGACGADKRSASECDSGESEGDKRAAPHERDLR